MEILNIFSLPLPYSAIFLLATFLSAHGLSFSFFSVVCYSIQNKILGVARSMRKGVWSFCSLLQIQCLEKYMIPDRSSKVFAEKTF